MVNKLPEFELSVNFFELVERAKLLEKNRTSLYKDNIYSILDWVVVEKCSLRECVRRTEVDIQVITKWLNGLGVDREKLGLVSQKTKNTSRFELSQDFEVVKSRVDRSFKGKHQNYKLNIDKILKMFMVDEHSQSYISKNLGLGETVLAGWLKDLGVDREYFTIKIREKSPEELPKTKDRRLPLERSSFSEDFKRVELLFKQGYDFIEIAKKTGISESAVRSWLDEAGLREIKPRRKVITDDLEKIKEMLG